MFINVAIFLFAFAASSIERVNTASHDITTSSDDEESLFSQSAKQFFIDAATEQQHNGVMESRAASPALTRVLQLQEANPFPFVLTDVELQCADEWDRFEGKCLKAVPIERSWPQALAFCSRFGAVLARLESARINAFLVKLLARPQRTAGIFSQSEHWIGLLHRPAPDSLSTSGTFLWSDGTQTSRYVGYWARGQPDSSKGSCTKAVIDGQSSQPSWKLDVCNLLLPFVCQRNACLKGSFFCHNGACVPERTHCNGVDDCGDLSDELNCPTAHSEQSCQRYDKGESGRIETPNFPAPYRAGTNCRWVLEGPMNSKIQLTFDSFETEQRQDLVTIFDGGPAENSTIAMATISGIPRTPSELNYESSTNRMVVRFRADQSIQARGFQASWRAVSITCGGFLKAQSLAQQLHSPEWPRHYPNGMECVWRIQAPAGQLISLSIDEFDTEAEKDFLVIYNGHDPSASVLARFSGKQSEPQLIISTQSQLYVYFFSSQTNARKGFSITFKKGCDNVIHRSNGVLTSPGNALLPYAESQICRWNIELPAITAQSATTDAQQMGMLDEENHHAKSGNGGAEMPSLTLALNTWDVADGGDQLLIFEGGDETGGGRALHDSDMGFSLNNAPPKTMYTKHGHVQIVWRANGLNNGLGWNISFSINCPPLVLPSRRVLLSTKNTAYGIHVTVSCERGYEFITGRGRHFEMQCELGGRWSDTGPVPDCQPVYCSAIPQIANGFAISATNVSFSGMARYQCYDGFGFASGKKLEEIFCTDEGRWTPSPKCKTETCPALPVFQFGERLLHFGDGIGFGSVYEFHCSKGYHREGPASIVCQSNGEWSALQPQCNKLTCNMLPPIENGELLLTPSMTDEKEKHQQQQNSKLANKEQKRRIIGFVDEMMTASTIRELQFGESLRVECNSGFRSVGAETLKCLANQTLSGSPECRDIDECAEQLANCAPKSTYCVNMAGGYHCQCQTGYKPQLTCTASTSILGFKVRTPQGVPVPMQQLTSKNGWCDSQQQLLIVDKETNNNGLDSSVLPSLSNSAKNTTIVRSALIFNFFVPKIIEKLRFEKIFDPSLLASARKSESTQTNVDNDGIWPQRFVLSYALDEGMAPQLYTFGLAETGASIDGNGTTMKMETIMEEKRKGKKADNTNVEGELRTRGLGVIGSEILVLAKPIEARTVRIDFLKFHGALPCVRMEFIGCQRTACEDINECEDGRNGGCEQHCHNMHGGHRCSCGEGFDLLIQPGQSGIRLREGETGYGQMDSYRYNRSCIPRHCAPLTAPENGQLIARNQSSATPFDSFVFPSVVEFRCAFGHQMRGPSYLKCLADGTWNGTAPTCIPANCFGAKNNTAVGLFVQPDSVSIPFGQNLSFVCSQTNRPARHTPLGTVRQCIYDPRTDGLEYWLSGPDVDCPLVDCGPPPALSGAYYEGDEGHGGNFKVGSVYLFQCRAPYSLVGKSSYDDRMVRCNVDGTWDLGDLRCEGPVCVDPGHPDDGQTHLDSVEESAIARFSCNRPGYRPFPEDTISCSLGTPCVLSEDVGISSGFIPDGAFSDNSDKVIWGYEPHKARMSSSGWCGSKDAFIFLSVDLQRIYTLTTLRLTGVAGNGHLAGHVTKMQLFYKVQFSQNYDNYPMEFTIPSGNHKKIHQFTLDPPLRARYILLGITEYEKNPCLKFDMHGCLAPLSAAHEVPSHLQVGWNASIPQCIDAEPPVFKNCPQLPVLVQTDDNGQLLPATYTIPEAVDNSGRIAYMRTKPEDFQPPYPVSQDTDVVYQAFDDAGNMAECVIRLRTPDTVPPIVKCPDSYAVWAQENQTELFVQFNESSVRLVVQDMSPISQTTFEPTEAHIHLGEHVTVEVSVTDVHSNRNKCKFQVALLPEPCSPWSLPIDDDTVQKQCQRHGTGTVCQVECRKGYRFLESVPQKITNVPDTRIGLLPQRYTCSLEQNSGKWMPNPNPPACVPIAIEPARYEMQVHMNYTLSAPMPSECLKSYEFMVGSLFDGIDQVLSQRCSSTVQIFVRFLDARFSPIDEKTMSANFTVQILPTVLQHVFYELCSLTLRTIFDLRIPGATLPIRTLLALSADSVPTAQNIGCPPMNATSIVLSQGFTCSQGELLKMMSEVNGNSESSAGTGMFSAAAAPGLPECLPCPKGTAFINNNTCVQCPLGSYQDSEGQIRCKPCPENTYTLQPGAQTNESCLAVCGNGMFSETGMIPCQLCPRHTFAGPPPSGGYRQCEACPEGTYTARLGSVGPSHCKQPCTPGHFSVTGLEPCSPCPVNFYQPNIGQQRCLQCSNDSYTVETGRFAEEHCKKLDCQTVKCQNRGQCVVANHKEICECRPGYTGAFCEQQIPLCDSKPCLNGGTCELHNGAFRCVCAQNYTGSRCQFGPDECISSVHCPNGGVCQDLPGLGTTKCICRTGFTGSDCSQIADPCQSEQPCRNGAQCVPLQLGRFKCKCLPGWEGGNCERNIDDCAENPCALGAKCHDLINDFECECPHGFSGKRCQIKDDLCEPNPCLNGGQCVDTLFDRHCVCKAGWNGTFCEQEMNECASNPCQNGAICRDRDNGYSCECAPGYYGYQCQYPVDHCAVTPCRNNGTCVNRGPNYECECRLGFEGTHCEHNVDECETQMPCDAAGTERCEDMVNAFKCHCRLGYEGTFCEQHISQCESEPCRNNGTCVDMGSGFQCECQPGWRGGRCEDMESQCEKRPCLNEGKCIPLVDDYFCVCPEGVSGKNCELAPNRCIGEPCHNGGVCGDFGFRSECACPKAFTGQGCQFRLDACRAGLCQNGGTCVNEDAQSQQQQMTVTINSADFSSTFGTPVNAPGFKCICAPGFTGAECEVDINECQPSPCPLSAQCVDLVNGYYCKCPFNMTGANCEKRIDPDYDLHFMDAFNQPANAGLAIPFQFAASAMSLSIWVRFEKAGGGSGDGGVNANGKMTTSFSAGGIKAKAAPIFFTLYSSQSASHPSNLTELMHISSESVYVNLFPYSNASEHQQPLILHFPAHQRPDTGRTWNNLVFTWNGQQGGAYSLVWNAVRLYADKGYATGQRLDTNAWVNLGDPPTAYEQQQQQTKKEGGSAVMVPAAVVVSKFVGSITRVNMWNRVLDFEHEIPTIVQRCQRSLVLYDGLTLRFANYDRLEGKVERIGKSSCGRTSLQCRSIGETEKCGAADFPASSSPSYHAENNDEAMFDISNPNGAVDVIGCPVEDIFVQTQLKEVNVSWEEPTFMSPGNEYSARIARVERNLKPGQVFTWGQYSAIYVAYDNRSFPLAQCEFKINVIRKFCSQPETPVNGLQQCEQWGAGLRYRACSIQCQSGFSFSRPPAVFYSCNEEGEWRPNEAFQHPFQYPQCTRQSPAEHLARIHLSYPQLALCNPAGKSTLTEKLLQRINQLNAKWHICVREESSDCLGVQVQIHCQQSDDIIGNNIFKRTAKRQVSQQQMPPSGAAAAQQRFGVTIDVPIRNGLVLDPIGSQQSMEPQEVIREEAFTHGLFSLEQVLPNGRPDLGAFRVENAFLCPSGYVLVTNRDSGNCVPCAPGTFYVVGNEDECQLCPMGQYQPGEGQTGCLQCPSTHPITIGMGAIRESECRVRCPPGQHLNITSGQCTPCGYGFYQPDSGAIECLPCGIGKTTLESTATTEEQCRDECPDGEQLTAGGSCQPCPLGTYRTRGQDKQCVECPAGTTTEDIGSARREACNTPKCSPGQFLVVSEKRCQFCARGTFQDQPLQTECKKCQPAFNTAKEGATRESQCYSTDQCTLGQDNCSWNAQCIDMPDENDVPSWRCVCHPGFRGNGVNCTDACLNFCLNDGICRKNKLGHVECACKENFSGERCEIRFQPRSQKLVYWTGAIVSVVFLLIVIVVVIWMISLRFNRSNTDSNTYFHSSMDKPSALPGLGPGADSPMASNFLYGRPPPLLERSAHHSSMASIRPIGFYYEDEQPYEQSSHQSGTGGGGNGMTIGGVGGRHIRESSQEMKSIFFAAPDDMESMEASATMNAEAGGGGTSSEDADSGRGNHSLIAGNNAVKSNQLNTNNGSPPSATRELEQRLRHIQQHMYKSNALD